MEQLSAARPAPTLDDAPPSPSPATPQQSRVSPRTGTPGVPSLEVTYRSAPRREAASPRTEGGSPVTPTSFQIAQPGLTPRSSGLAPQSAESAARPEDSRSSGANSSPMRASAMHYERYAQMAETRREVLRSQGTSNAGIQEAVAAAAVLAPRKASWIPRPSLWFSNARRAAAAVPIGGVPHPTETSGQSSEFIERVIEMMQARTPLCRRVISPSGRGGGGHHSHARHPAAHGPSCLAPPDAPRRPQDKETIETFARFDADSSGAISRDELTSVITMVTFLPPPPST